MAQFELFAKQFRQAAWIKRLWAHGIPSFSLKKRHCNSGS
jgi:hypothetical protein